MLEIAGGLQWMGFIRAHKFYASLALAVSRTPTLTMEEITLGLRAYGRLENVHPPFFEKVSTLVLQPDGSSLMPGLSLQLVTSLAIGFSRHKYPAHDRVILACADYLAENIRAFADRDMFKEMIVKVLWATCMLPELQSRHEYGMTLLLRKLCSGTAWEAEKLRVAWMWICQAMDFPYVDHGRLLGTVSISVPGAIKSLIGLRGTEGLFKQLGGEEGIAKAVQRLYEYKGRELKRIHQMIDIYDYHMDAFVNLMKNVLEEADQDPETIDSCIILMETCRSRIVKPANHDVRRAQAMANKKPLYERLGGEMSIAKLSEMFYTEAMEDSRTKSFFEKNKAKVATIKKKITQLIGTVTGGSKQYDLADLKPSHYSMNITDFHFDAVICIIRQAGETLHINSKDLEELISILQKLRPEITTGCTVRREMARQNLARCETGEGLYERLFETEGIARLMDTLFNLISKDARIKEFFPVDSMQLIKEAKLIFFIELFGGPPEYEGRDLTDIHEPLGITDYHFDAFLSDMSRALLSQGHEDSLVDEVIITLDSVRNAVLDRQSELVIEPRNGLNLLERFGGDSNLEAVAEGMYQYFTEDSRINYDEENVQPVHYHMNITDYHFDAVIEMFHHVFVELDIHPNAITDSLAELGRCRKLITTGCTVRMEVAKKNEEMGTDLMFVKMGYDEGLEDFIKRLFDLSKVDRRLKRFFQGKDLHRIRTGFQGYLTERFGGPTQYKGRELEDIHRGLGLDDFYFDCFLINAEKALHGLGVEEDIIADVLITLEFARAHVLNRKRDQLSQLKLVDGATIFERIGGDMNLEAVVETMYSGALLDPRIKFFFDLPKDRVEQIKERMCTFLSMITGAPEVKYDVKALKEIHRGINITDYHFDALMENMKVACELMEIDNTVRVDFLECVSHVRGIITAGCTVRLELAKRRTEIGGTEGLFKQLGGEEGIAKAVQRLYEYKGRELKRIHQMIDIYDYHMDAFVNLMKSVLEEADQDPETIDSCIILMETCRSRIVKPANHDVRRAQAMANKKPLYERLGTKSFFEKNKAKIATIKKKITQLIGTVTGGSKQYDLADLKPSHFSMNITDFHFDAVICIIRQAGETLHINSKDLEELISILQKLRPEITTGCTVRREMARQNLARCETGEGLYERLFETEGIARLMDTLFNLISKDARIREFFPVDSMQIIKEAKLVFFIELFGGPPEYEGRDLTDIHEPLCITDYHFDAFLSDMSRALLSQGHEDSLVDEVIITLDSVRNAVLDRQSELVIEPRNGLNLLERFGGDSNLEAVAEGMYQYFTEDSRIKYDQDDLKPVHYDMNISDYHFDAVLECFVKSAEELEDLDEDAISDALQILNSVRSDIIAGSRVRMDAAERKTNEDGIEELFKRIGKVEGVEKFVDQLYERVERDKRIYMFFEGAKLQAIKKAQTDYFIGLFGGPNQYKGRSLEDVHQIIAMNDYHVDCFFLNIQKCLGMMGFNNETIDQFVVHLEKLRPQILHHHYKNMMME
ncbi:hypothetical protein Pmar_PMAR024802 [Perkinsus marinus ATCC 50983]|uniref:Uncharacterized protein n=2 Tax=Perkinsus marinus (strain ATCC 50983 / TXsc) TaxID=423536 RepID=C5M185_PERM5|nr:hypothetical protein Pmar_PMAR024802 [Perkinsus marinus ATCC 50983]EEQ97315.1 hypothetical protein Pmar_PMAR024802 [Perkinsus marinus ATCC 50983]|eukprot:XP_002764598.1 hypothetical protein Pmar_PMAR024802 [Perkinsus marinus ATCC 50983]